MGENTTLAVILSNTVHAVNCKTGDINCKTSQVNENIW